MSEIDFGCPIEAVHIINGIVSSVEPHCRPFNKESAYSGKAGAGCVDAFYDSWRKDGTPINPNNPWHIRNVQPTPSTDRLARLEAFVARVARGHPSSGFVWNDEAKALVDELNPVDPDVLMARDIVAEAQPIDGNGPAHAKRYRAGDWDADTCIVKCVEALRQARKEGNDNGK